MLMKVFGKGQVVIPAEIRHELDIEIGDRLEVSIDREAWAIELRKPATRESEALAGSLATYVAGRSFPTRADMAASLREGLARE